MPTTPRNSLQYPAASDPVAQGADAMRKLAVGVENMVQSGSVVMTIATGGVSQSQAVAFPVPFLSPPAVVATYQAGQALTTTSVSASSPTTTGFNLNCIRNSSGTQTVMWVAVGQIATVT